MSVVDSSSVSHVHPDWVSMDIEKLGKSFYTSDGQPLNEHIRELKKKTLQDALRKRERAAELLAAVRSSETPASENISEDVTVPDSPEEPTVVYGDVQAQKTNRPKPQPIVQPTPNPEEQFSDEIFFEYSRTTDGLVNSRLRSQIWPILLGIEVEASPKATKLGSASASLLLEDLNSTDLPPHKDEDQVKLDIQRSFTILTHIQSLNHLQSDSYTTIFSKSDIGELKKKLQHIIIKILRKYPVLNYYQGYHDIASIVLLVCHTPQESDDLNSSGIMIDEVSAFKILEKLTLFHLRDFMITDINLSVNHLRLIPTILESTDPEMFQLIKQSSNSYILSDGLGYDYSFFQGLSSVLTFFSHDISNLQHILIIWDFILSYNSIVVLEYIYVSALIFYKDSIFKRLSIAKSSDHNFDSVDKDLVHTLISPASLFDGMTDQDLIKILNKTSIYVDNFPINSLDNTSTTFDIWFNNFNKHSVLLNTSCLYLDRAAKSKLPTEQHDSDSLNDVLQIQDEEMARQTIHDLQIQRKIMEQQEELESSMHTTNTEFDDSLNSSSLSLSSYSSFNSRVANTSSLIYKKIFKTHSPEVAHDKKVTNIHYFNNIYKISFTVGFVGFMLHFLLSRNNGYNQTIARIFSPTTDFLGRLGETLFSNESLKAWGREMTVLGRGLVVDAASVLKDASKIVAEPVNNGLYVGQIGIGNLRNSVFSMFG